jgi:hypothetical protein
MWPFNGPWGDGGGWRSGRAAETLLALVHVPQVFDGGWYNEVTQAIPAATVADARKGRAAPARHRVKTAAPIGFASRAGVSDTKKKTGLDKEAYRPYTCRKRFRHR